MADLAIPTVRPTSDKPPRRRRWIPLSLRMFLAIMALLFVVGAVWVGVPMNRQLATIREIRDIGGDVEIKRPSPGWLVRLVGDRWSEALGGAISVNLQGQVELPNGICERIGHVQSIDELDLTGCQLTDSDFEYINRLTSLRVLSLTSTKVTDVGIHNLAGLKSLESLLLADTQITDAGLEHVSQLTGLRELAIDLTAVTDRGLIHLQKLRHLEYLYVHDANVTEEGVSELTRALPKLTVYWQR